jgi:hypothetical protein
MRVEVAPRGQVLAVGDRPKSLRNSSFALFKTRRLLSVRFVPALLISKFSMDMADRNGLDLRRGLASAERFRECATATGLRSLNTPDSRSIASLCCMTFADQRTLLTGLRDTGDDVLFCDRAPDLDFDWDFVLVTMAYPTRIN